MLSGQKYPKNNLFYFEKRSTGLNQYFVIADVSLGHPRYLFSCSVKNVFTGWDCPESGLFQFENKITGLNTFWYAVLERPTKSIWASLPASGACLLCCSLTKGSKERNAPGRTPARHPIVLQSVLQRRLHPLLVCVSEVFLAETSLRSPRILIIFII